MHALLLAATVVLQGALPDVVLHRDLPYGDDPVRQSLDVYQPTAPGPARPFLVFIHGGGWSEGDKGTHPRKGSWFARQGFVYASINYRLSPAVQHPAHVEDVAQAIFWLHQNAWRFGADPERFVLLGHSAGAHLAALVATDPRRLGAYFLAPELIRAVVLLDGSGYDVTRRIPSSRGWSRSNYVRAFGEDPGSWKDASPYHHLEEGRVPPPFLLFHVLGRATSHLQAEAFAERLREVQGKVEVVGVAGRSHVSISRRLGMPQDPVAHRLLRFVGAVEEESLFPSP